MKAVISLAVTGILLYTLAALAMYLLQRKLMYHPTPVLAHPFTERSITVDTNVNLSVLELNPDKPDAVIYFGGNAEWVAGSAAELSAALPEKTLYLANYRGYSGSDGTPTETHLFNDAEKIFDEVAPNHQDISVIGRSLGSGVACYLASRKPVSRLLLITPFDSILRIAQSAYPIFPVHWLLKDRYESVKYAPSIKAPVLALMAERDSVIPADSSQRLVEQLPGKSHAHVFDNTGHNDLQMHPDFYPSISVFLK